MVGRPPTVAQRTCSSAHSLTAGLALGLLWTVEILINNVATPPVPLRDVVDDLFWAAVAAGIFALSVRAAYRERRFAAGVAAGLWTGTASGWSPAARRWRWSWPG